MKFKRVFIPIIMVLGISIMLTSCQASNKEPLEAVDPAPPQQLPQEDPLPAPDFVKDYGPAPELQNDIWLNTDEPLRLADLKGKVVLLEMWTFG